MRKTHLTDEVDIKIKNYFRKTARDQKNFARIFSHLLFLFFLK